jgi:hypothetical protein
MSRSSGNTKRVEVWTVRNPKSDERVTTPTVSVTKVAVRDSLGRFHGATNFPQRG